MNIPAMVQMPMAAACDNLFPPLLGRLYAHGILIVGIIISALMYVVLLVLDIQVYVSQQRHVSNGPPGN